MNAAELGNPELIQVLIAAGADTYAQDKAGQTALMYYVLNASSKITGKTIEILASLCDIDAKDKDGKTALVHAIDRNDLIQVKVLLKKGASTKKGKDVLKFALRVGADNDIIKLLKKHIIIP